MAIYDEGKKKPVVNKPKPPASPVHDSPSDPGHGTNPVTGKPGPVLKNHPVSYNPPAWVIRRQQALRRAGWRIAVDGIWGPASQAAWSAYSAGRKAESAWFHGHHPAPLAPGMTYYQGRVVPVGVARAAQAVEAARRNAAGVGERSFLQGARAQRQKAWQAQQQQKQLRQLAASDPAAARHLSLQAAIHQRQAAAKRHSLLHSAQLNAYHQREMDDRRLFGVHGIQALTLNPGLTRQRLANIATAHDLSRLIGEGTLSSTRPGDVRVIQAVINREGGHVAETGQYDQATAAALGDLFTRAAAQDFKRGVSGLASQFWSNGLGQWATYKVYGREMTAAETYGVLTRGGPRAARLAAYLGQLYEQTEPVVNQARQALAQQVYHLQTGDVHYGNFSDAELVKLLGPAAAGAHTMTAFYARVGAELDRRRGLAARHDTSWWQDGLGWIGEKVGALPGATDVADALSWSGHQGYHLLATTHTFVYSNLDALQNSVARFGPVAWAGDATGVSIDAVGWMSKFQKSAMFGGLTLQGYVAGNYLLPDDSAWRGRGYTSLDQAWHNGWVTMDDMRKADPLREMVWEMVADPLNLVGVGEAKTLISAPVRLERALTARSLIYAAEGSDYAVRSPQLASLIRDAAHAAQGTDQLLADLLTFPSVYYRGGRLAEWVTKLRRTKAEGIAVARDNIRADVARNFEKVALKPPAPAPTAEGEDAVQVVEQAAHTDAADRAAVENAQDGSYAQKALDPLVLDELRSVTARQASALRSTTPNVHAFFSGLGTSLYRHYGYLGGHLSQAGREVAATLTERANRAILEAAAAHLAGEDEALLREYMSQLGTWMAGHPHPDIAEYADLALADFKRLLYDQILPDLDRVARAGLPPETWDKLGYLVDEVPPATADALLKLRRGQTFEELFNPKNYVDVANPGYLRRVSLADAQRLQRLEIDRRISALDQWAEHAKWRSRNDAPAAARIHATVVRRRAEINADVLNGWVFHPDKGYMQDARQTFSVPKIYARPSALGEAPALDREIQRIIDTQLAAGATPVARPGAEPIAGLVDDTTRRAELQAAYRSEISAHHYRQQFLITEAMNHAQGIIVRTLWGSYKAMLELWRFAVLPLRPAFAFKNFVEDFLKMVMAGFRDFRLLFNTHGESIFGAAPVRLVRAIARNLDALFGTDLDGAIQRSLEALLASHPDEVRKLFAAHGIDIPTYLFNDSATQSAFLGRSALTRKSKLLARYHELIWDLMGSRPDNWRKRALYADAYLKALKRTGGDEIAAGEDAVDAMDAAARAAETEVDRVLFLYDADHISVLEEQLKVFAPFIAYWTKNARFFGSELNRRPWWFANGKRLYDLHSDTNDDQPVWMRRYFSLAPIGSLASTLGAPDWVANAFKDAYFDPLDFTGTAAFYRYFKSANPNLPPEARGFAFVSGLVGDLNSFGIGLNPLVAAVASNTGLIDRQVWRDFFPQTSFIQALTTKGFLQDTFGPTTGFNIEDFLTDPILSRMGATPNSQLRRDNFDYYVNAAVAAQVARGEQPDRARAERDIARWMALQQIVGFVAGIYGRHLTEQDLHFYAIQTALGKNGIDAWQNLSDQEQESYRLWGRKGYNPQRFDAYRAALENARAYYLMEPGDREQYLAQHPEIIGIVHPIAGDDANLPTQIALNHEALAQETGVVISLLDVFSNPDFDTSVTSAAYNALVTPDLKAFWASNDTPAERRARAVKGAYFHYIDRMSRAFHSIPATDYDTRQRFLDAHPELPEWWRQNDRAADDFKSIQLAANATFRDVYFRFLDAGDWDNADAFLARHPFIFDWTSAEGRITPGGHWIDRSQAQADYAKVRPLLAVYYELSGDARTAYAAANPIVPWYLNKYGAADGLHADAVEYDQLRARLDAYFRLPKGALREAFLNHHPELRDYFSRHGHDRTVSQHARDYLAVKPQLDAYFSLDESQRAGYLAAHPELRAYFDKYGSADHHAAVRTALAHDPEIAARYHFWQQFFALSPGQRPAFVHAHAADAGIFIYGSLSYDQQMREEQRWRREAVAAGTSARSVAYRHIKPLMDVYFRLNGPDRSLFLELNPELRYYFDHYAKHSTAIPPGIVPLLETYFAYQPYSAQRKEFIAAHPELADYFASTNSPTEKAMLRQVEAFFALPFGPRRDHYLALHPELAEWFDKRQQEKRYYESVTAAFNAADPRMRPYYEMYADIIPLDAIKQWQLGLAGAKPITQGEARRERSPQTRRKPGWRASSG